MTIFKLALNEVTLVKNKQTILHQVSTVIQQGERIGLMGCNGSGKTQLARLIAGLSKPTSGKVKREPDNLHVTLILQRPEEHFVHNSILSEVKSYVLSPGKVNKAKLALSNVGFCERDFDRHPMMLSSGGQRLLAIAAAFASQAPLIVMDEPMAWLDSKARLKVKEGLRSISSKEDCTYLIISHHPDDLLGVVDRLWILDEGKMLYDGPFTDVSPRILETCIDERDPSRYYLLSRLNDKGYPISKDYFHELDLSNIDAMLIDLFKKEGVSS